MQRMTADHGAARRVRGSRWMCVLFAALAVRFAGAAPLELVREGEPRCVIVLPDAPSVTEQVAAAELAQYIEKAAGARIETVGESRLPALLPQPPFRVVVGKCRLTGAAGLAPEALKNEEILIAAQGDALFVLGGDSSQTADPRQQGEFAFGTLFAAYEVLERFLGVRWYWPGELGEIVPAQRTIAVPGDVRIRETPDFDYRYVYGNHADDPAITREQSVLWWRRQRIGSACAGKPGTHSFNGWVARFAKSNPEYFALQKDGTRMLDGEHGGGHVCPTLPAVREQIVADCLEAFKDPARKTFSVWPGDSPELYGCTCPSCEALLDRKGPASGFNSRPVWQLVNDVAREVGKTHPDRWIVGGAYASHADIPPGMTFEPNVSVTLCDDGLYWNRADIEAYQTRIEDWRKRVGSLYLWHYYQPEGPGQFLVAPHAIQEMWHGSKGRAGGAICEVDYGFAPQHGGNWPLWEINALNLYVYMKCLWRTERDVDAMLRDYCRDLFGPAGDAMHRFYAGLEARLLANRETDVRRDGKWETFWTRLYPPATVAGLMACLDEAEALAPTASVFAKRLAVVRRGFAPMREVSKTFAAGMDQPIVQITCPAVPEGLAQFDGRIGADEWAKAARTAPFVVAGSGQPASRATDARIMQDGRNLYIGWTAGLRAGQPVKAKCDNPDQTVWWDDNFEAFFFTEDTYYQFIVTSRGVLWDARGADTAWNGGARVKTFVAPDFWSGELVVPLEALADLPKPLPMANVTWKANFGRVYYDQPPDAAPAQPGKPTWKEELQMWSPVFEAGFNKPERAGILRFP